MREGDRATQREGESERNTTGDESGDRGREKIHSSPTSSLLSLCVVVCCQYEFNCGSMEMSSSKTVTADKRKGKVVLTMEDDGLLRFQWRLRLAETNEQQYFIFPQGATWTRVKECKDGRVYLLKFKDSDVRHKTSNGQMRRGDTKGEGSSTHRCSLLFLLHVLLLCVGSSFLLVSRASNRRREE